MPIKKSVAITDSFWSLLEPLIPKKKRPKGRMYRRKPGGGRKPMEPRKVFDAIIYVLRNRVPWKALPPKYGSASSVHAYFKAWEKTGVFGKIWKKGLAKHYEMNGIAWERHLVDPDGAVPKGKRKKWKRAAILRGRLWRPLVARRFRREQELLDVG